MPKKSKSKMFPFITDTVNPIGLECPYGCSYCWSQSETGLVKKYNMKKYQGSPQFCEGELSKIEDATKNEFLFIEDMSDLMTAPVEMVQCVLNSISKSNATCLLLTKNPYQYLFYWMPMNVILGCTIESNRNYSDISNAPLQSERMEAMFKISQLGKKTFVSIEPIMDFDIIPFMQFLNRVKPWAVAIGYDNYKHHLDEPSLTKTVNLELTLETKVYEKTFRKAWWEQCEVV